MKTFPIAPYNFRLHFTTSKKDMQAAYNELFKDTLDLDAAGISWRNGYDCYIGVFDKGPACIDTLAHEISHCVIGMSRFIGYNPGSEEEPFAFLTGYITKLLMFAHPKFKEAMNEPVGIRAGNGGRRAPKGDGSHNEQRGSGTEPQQSVCSGSVPPVCNATKRADRNVLKREEAWGTGWCQGTAEGL